MADFSRLYGREMVAFCREVSPGYIWDRGIFRIDSPPLLDCQGRIGALPFRLFVAPELRRPPALVPVTAALRAGELGLIADGDESMRYAIDTPVPLPLLRLDFMLVAEIDAGAYLRGREQRPRYYRPRFCPPADDEDPTYGDKSAAVLAAMIKHEKELAALKTRDAKAAFLADKARCSKSLATKVLISQGR